MKQGEQLLETRMYNTFIDAYISLASCCETMHRGNWVEDAWLFYDAMECESAHVRSHSSGVAPLWSRE